MTRMNLLSSHKDGYQAVIGLDTYCRENVPGRLYELVKLRASIVNGCSFCTDMHSREGQEQGIPVSHLFGVAAWHESRHFDAAERAALALTDAITRLGEGGVSDAVWDEAAAHYDEKALGDLVLAIATINVWNRIAISTRLLPPK